jgi:hypothetical protein
MRTVKNDGVFLMKIISTVHISYQISNELISINTNKYVLTYTVRVTLLPMYLHIIICSGVVEGIRGYTVYTQNAKILKCV